MKHLRYLIYILRHKWFVFIECCRLGIFWRGITHDLSKFLPFEWEPYADRFFGNGYHADDFEKAWAHHWRFNDHHWQHWVLYPKKECQLMSYGATREMVADWIAMGKTQGNNALAYYKAQKDNILLHPVTRKNVEFLLNYEN